MESYFLKRFQTKKKQELKEILENAEEYDPAAVRAAESLLTNWIEEQPTTSTTQMETPKQAPRYARRSHWIEDAFDYRPYFQTFSHRDVLTFLTLTIFWIAFDSIIDLYSGEEILSGIHRQVIGWTAVAIFLLNHVFYKIEYGKSNNFLGRSISDILLFLSFVVLIWLYDAIIHQDFTIDIEEGVAYHIGMLIGLIFVAFIFELGVGIVKLILKFLRCPVF